MADIEEFIDRYIDTNAWRDGKDVDTCRENAQKYAVSLRGTRGRLGWFEWLDEEQNKSLDEATETDVQRFLRYLQEQGLSAPTRMQARSGISQYYQLMDTDAPNPVEQLDASWSVTTDKEQATGSERHYLSKDDVREMIENVPTPTLRSEVIIKLLYQTGMRRMELATVEVERIDLEDREIRVYGEKSNEWRTVTFRESLRAPLNLWLNGPRKDAATFSEDNPYLFPSPTTGGNNNHIAGKTVGDAVVESAKNAGVQDTYGTDATGKNQHKVTAHTLRHTFAVHAAENGVPAPHLKEVLGHHNLNITQIYVDIAGADAVDMLKKRGPSL